MQNDAMPLAFSAALDVLSRRRATGEPLDRVMAAIARERHLGPRERRATADLAFGWARHAAVVEPLVTAAAKSEGGVVPRRQTLDLAGLALAAVAAGLDVDDRALSALPGSMRALVEDALALGLSWTVSLPPWLSTRLTASFGEEAAAVTAALLRPAPTVVAVDRRLAEVSVIAAALAEVGVTTTPSSLSPTALRVTKGRLSLSLLPTSVRRALWPMDDGSQAVAHAVMAEPGERVLDLCAGGGGKARLLAATGARVTAVDIDAGRLSRSLPEGVSGIVADGTAPPFAPGSFDRVLVDAPCSGTGTLRRAPDLALRLQESDLAGLVTTQRALLSQALRLVRPGGRVVYATCSLLPDENDDVVTAVVDGHPEVVRLPSPFPFGPRGLLTPPVADGFFVALLERRG